MQFTFDLIINPIILFLAVIVGALAVVVINKNRLAKSQRRIKQLENEMISSHAEILEMQKAYVRMETRLKDQSIPVIPMKINGKENNPKEKASK
jgi:cell division protein FtsL